MKTSYKIYLQALFLTTLGLLSGCGGGGDEQQAVAAFSFTSNNTININENSNQNIELRTNSSSVTYAMSGVDSHNLDINSSSGIISFQIAPDYETKNSYSFEVTADNGISSITQILTININNLVDVVATLEDFNASIEENATIGTLLGSVVIFHTGEAQVSSFTLSDTTNFEVNASGAIRSKTTLDYETNSFYNLTLFATSAAGTSQNIRVDINIIDRGSDLSLKSAVYDDNRTITVLDDKLYVYFNKSINPNSIAADASANYVVEGVGVIGSASVSEYNDTLFHRHTLSLNSNGSGSNRFTLNDTNLSIATNVIEDLNGSYAISDAVSVEEFRILFQTNQTECYNKNDVNSTIVCTHANAIGDATDPRGRAVSYVRDNTTEIVSDTVTGLMWEDGEETRKQWLEIDKYDTCRADNSSTSCYDTSGDTAASYCSSLSLGGFNDWRLPTLEELRSINDISKYHPSINTIFQNTALGEYHTSITRAQYKHAIRIINFANGSDTLNAKKTNLNVRCVR